MRILIPLILLLVLTIACLWVYVVMLRRKIRESENPLLALTRKQRREYALAQLEQEREQRVLERLQQGSDIIKNFNTPTLGKKETV